jgi:hypothetical protein
MIATMRCFFHMALLFLALSSATAAAVNAGANIHARDQQLQDLTAWLRSEGGYFNPKLEIRRADPSDPTSAYGIFALATIQLEERLMDIKSSSTIRHQVTDVNSLLVDDDNDDDDEDEGASLFQALCGLTERLLKELRLGVKSKYAAYVDYLLVQEHGQIPATWSQAGKALLLKVMHEEDPEEGLGMLDWIQNTFEGECIQRGNSFEIQALALVAQREYDGILIPLFDMINHSNDKEAINIKRTSLDLDVVRVWASREIPAGQELFTTYDQSAETPEILRDYGFVESYPRKFRLGRIEEDLLFSIHENKQTKELEVTWEMKDKESPDVQGIGWMQQYRKKLQNLLHGRELEANRNNIPKKEWDVIFEYLQVILTAVDSAIQTAIYDLSNSVKQNGDCKKDGSCSVPWLSYADLDESIRASDDEYFWIYQCETLVYGIDHFDLIGSSDSHYQSMDYYMDEKTKEMCFHIDGVFQMCSSYRPHYHEMGVHVPARYLVDSLKRVLWIGGGDAMLLHEILKYPDLELAVGLELDQKVTRGAFKYFGVQPHFDNEKVQWWFGDASKSLLMLPEDYFGSFDMVLVDLSDTVLSLSVTKEMDIIGALSLLLKPDGIFAMNELVRC